MIQSPTHLLTMTGIDSAPTHAFKSLFLKCIQNSFLCIFSNIGESSQIYENIRYHIINIVENELTFPERLALGCLIIDTSFLKHSEVISVHASRLGNYVCANITPCTVF